MYIDEDSEESSPFVMLSSPTKSWVSPHNVNKESGDRAPQSGVRSPKSGTSHHTSPCCPCFPSPRCLYPVSCILAPLPLHTSLNFTFRSFFPRREIEEQQRSAGEKKLAKSLNDFCCFSKCFLMVYVCWPPNPVLLPFVDVCSILNISLRLRHSVGLMALRFKICFLFYFFQIEACFIYFNFNFIKL